MQENIEVVERSDDKNFMHQENLKYIQKNPNLKLIYLYYKNDIIDSAIVNEIYYERLNKYVWWKTYKGYAITSSLNDSMHQYIFYELVEGNKENYNRNTSVIDHRDRNKLNNDINNLHNSSESNNGRNKEKNENTSSIYYGVSFRKDV